MESENVKECLLSIVTIVSIVSIVLSKRDFDDVKDKFFHGDLSPARFLDELQRLLSRN